MRQNAFSGFHPAVNFLFFMAAICFGVVIQHPAYLLAGMVCSGIYYLILTGGKGWKLILGMIPLFVVITVINPFFNTRGNTVLMTIFGRRYTLEALIYGMVVGAMFVLMMLWFSCYNLVLTSDKFICLFGSLIPSLSLLLVMVLRLIPSFMRKTKQIANARNSIGKGGSQHTSMKDKALSGMTVLSALTDWALEGSIVTADSMRSRGYGAAKRTSFRQYTMTGRDWFLLVLEGALSLWVIWAAATGGAEITFAPYVTMAYITPAFGGYCVLLLLPTVIEIKEALQWHIIRSKI